MIKIGVFGVGHLGKFHLNNWLEIPEATICGFYDPDDATATQVAAEYGIKRYQNPRELMQVCDAADIVAPTTFHFDLCKMAITKCKHVFVEKPLVNTMAEAREIVKLAREANIKFQVGHVERFNPALLAAREYIVNPMFVEVHRLAQFNSRGTDVSVILDLMIHDIDIILSLIGSNVRDVHANGVKVWSSSPDIANVRLEFENGCVANLTSSRISMKRMRKMRLFQKDAYIGIDFLEKKAEIIKYPKENDSNLFTFDIETPGGKRSIAVATPEVGQNNAMKMELESFVEAILTNTDTKVNEIDGYRAMEVAHEILEKIKREQVL